MTRILIILVFLLGIIIPTAAQGLLFHGNESKIDERTSLELFTTNGEVICDKSFRLDFDLSIRDFSSFGYIFTMQDLVGNTTYSFTFVYLDHDTSSFKFNIDGVENIFSLNVPNENLSQKWIHLSFKFNLKNDSLVANIGEYSPIKSSLRLDKRLHPKLFFGIHDYILDTPQFGLKNLAISADNKKKWMCFFDESSGQDVHTEKGKIVGAVSNPTWLINKSYHWENLAHHRFEGPSGGFYNPAKKRIDFFSQDSLLEVDPISRKTRIYPYSNPLEVKLQLGTHFYNTTNGRLYAYELNNLPEGSTTVAALNLHDLNWESVGRSSLPVQLHHHTGLWNEATQKYFVFGGFGNKRYNNTFLEYDVFQDRWDTLHYDGPKIFPRYFSGLATSKDQKRTYIFGGKGNESGDQTVGHFYFYDLYLLDNSQRTVKNLWHKKNDKKFVVARDMVLSTDEKYLYALCYPEYISKSYLQLCRFAVKDGTMQLLGDSIPIRSEEIATNANLYFDSEINQYFCIINQFDHEGHTIVKAYSLSTPAISLDRLDKYTSSSNYILLYLCIGLALFVLILYIIYVSIRKHRQSDFEPMIEKSDAMIVDSATTNDSSEETSSIDFKAENHISQAFVDLQQSTADKANSIYLFGPFTVIDKTGMNITHLFSTKLRQVLLYILLHSRQGGVLSSALNTVFWADRPDDKAKNAKGVTISHIRKSLSNLDGIELVYQSGYFKLVFTSCYCDYFEYLDFIDQNSLPFDAVSMLVRGSFLSDTSEPIFDYVKSNVEEFLSTQLPSMIRQTYLQNQYHMVIRLCHILATIDSINEQALVYQIHAMKKIDLTQDSVLLYSKFMVDYRKAFGQDYSKSYSDILKKL